MITVPWATFTSPEVWRVGRTETAKVRQRRFDPGHPTARVAYLPLEHVDRAFAVGAEHGFVKLIAAPKRGSAISAADVPSSHRPVVM